MKIKILDGYKYLENEIGGDTKEIEQLIKDRIIERIGRNAIFSYYSFYDFLKQVYLQHGGAEEVVKIQRWNKSRCI